MTCNRTFLSYQHDSFADITRLAEELQFRGIVPWVDKLPGGFQAGDASEQEARRVIREDSSAFALYVTEKALCSDFIRDIEIPEAMHRQRHNHAYPIVVVSPHYRFSKLQELTRQHFGNDLTPAHGYAKEDTESLDDFLVRVSRQLLRRYFSTLPNRSETFELSVNSYEQLASTREEWLRIDATEALDGDVTKTEVWSRLLVGLQDAKVEISNRFGRPRLVINGSKHFTAAFMTGRVFNQFTMDIRQRDEYWPTDGPIVPLETFAVDYRPGPYTSQSLFVQLATGDKDIAAGVDRLIETTGLQPGGRLSIRPSQGRIEVNGDISRSLARVAYGQIDRAANAKPTDQIHIFVAAPQAFFMTLGSLFQGMPEVHLYEWTGDHYLHSVVIPARLR